MNRSYKCKRCYSEMEGQIHRQAATNPQQAVILSCEGQCNYKQNKFHPQWSPKYATWIQAIVCLSVLKLHHLTKTCILSAL